MPTKRPRSQFSFYKLLGLIAVLYSAYLLKTAAGINLSNRYTASEFVKAPLQPLWDNKAGLCTKFQSLCAARSKFQHKVQERINAAKHAV